jgi:hypothetical protein
MSIEITGIPLKRHFIRIVATPPGEAPEEIRKAWIGVRIPLPMFDTKPHEWRSAGVLTGPKNFLDQIHALFTGKFVKRKGYAVSANEAIAALQAANPEAAQWWRTNAPHMLEYGKAFVFAAEACREEVE